MDKIRGTLKTVGEETSLEAKRVAYSSLCTPAGEIRTVLEADGRFDVFIGEPGQPTIHILSGDVSRESRRATGIGDDRREVKLHETGSRR